jgi:hypothetical protein
MAAADGKVTKYRVTWGDGSSDLEETLVAARLSMGRQSDPVLRKGMRMTAVRV